MNDKQWTEAVLRKAALKNQEVIRVKRSTVMNLCRIALSNFSLLENVDKIAERGASGSDSALNCCHEIRDLLP